MSDNFKIGVITGVHGIKGEIRIFPTTDEPRRFDLLKHLDIEHNSVTKRYDIDKIWYHKQFVIAKLKGIDDRNSAERMKKAIITIEPSLALPLSEDEYYIRDLYGMTVFTEEGEELGIINDIIETGANDVYSVEGADGNTLLIPAIKKCILSVHVAEKKMIVKLLEGLR